MKSHRFIQLIMYPKNSILTSQHNGTNLYHCHTLTSKTRKRSTYQAFEQVLHLFDLNEPEIREKTIQ